MSSRPIPIITVTVMMLPPFGISLRRVCIVLASRLEQHLPLERIVHHCLVRRLFLLLDRKHGIFPNLRSGVPQRICILVGHEGVLIGILLKLLGLISFQQTVYASFSK